MTVLLLRMERNGTRMEQLKKKEREKNDLAEGPRSRTEWNDFKKVETCPALLTPAHKWKRNKRN